VTTLEDWPGPVRCDVGHRSPVRGRRCGNSDRSPRHGHPTGRADPAATRISRDEPNHRWLRLLGTWRRYLDCLPGFAHLTVTVGVPDRRERGAICPATSGVLIDQDRDMGSAGSKPRKPRRRIAKVPKYEEPNRAEGFTGGTFGRSGHGSDGHHAGKPGRAGSYFLKLLGKKPKT
jgi:hypothetical protein